MLAVSIGSRLVLTACSEATLAVPVFVLATVAVTGAAAAMPLGSSSTRRRLAAALPTGWSRKRSPATGAGPAMSMRNPSTTSPAAMLRTRPSRKRVSW